MCALVHRLALKLCVIINYFVVKVLELPCACFLVSIHLGLAVARRVGLVQPCWAIGKDRCGFCWTPRLEGVGLWAPIGGWVGRGSFTLEGVG